MQQQKPVLVLVDVLTADITDKTVTISGSMSTSGTSKTKARVQQLRTDEEDQLGELLAPLTI